MYAFLAFHVTVCVCACVYIYGIYIKYFTYILKYIKTYTSVDIYAHLKYTYILNLYTLIFVYMHIWNLKKLDFAFILIFEDWSWTSFNSINILLQHHFLPSFFLSCLFWLCYSACGILFPEPGIEFVPPEVEAQNLNH